MVMQVDKSWKDQGTGTDIDLDRIADRHLRRWSVSTPHRDNFVVPNQNIAVWDDRSRCIHCYDRPVQYNPVRSVEPLLFTGCLERKKYCENHNEQTSLVK